MLACKLLASSLSSLLCRPPRACITVARVTAAHSALVTYGGRMCLLLPECHNFCTAARLGDIWPYNRATPSIVFCSILTQSLKKKQWRCEEIAKKAHSSHESKGKLVYGLENVSRLSICVTETQCISSEPTHCYLLNHSELL